MAKLMVQHMEYGLANGVLCFSTVKHMDQPIHIHGKGWVSLVLHTVLTKKNCLVMHGWEYDLACGLSIV